MTDGEAIMADQMRRRFLVTASGAAVSAIAPEALLRLGRAAAAEVGALPRDVGGVAIPDTAIARAAAAMAREACPEHLYNHCIRTFLFGALVARRDRIDYDAEIIFTAAALHDLGLIERYSTPRQPFEMDGADAAKAFLEQHGVKGPRAEIAWNAIAMHTSPLSAHQVPQVQLVGGGAGVDVYGSGIKTLPADAVQAILAAFPRHGFRQGFPELLTQLCARKPLAQVGTWTDAYCRAHTHGVAFPEIDKNMDRFPFPDA
jgi:hypothetical protein